MKKMLLPLCALLAAASGSAQTGTPFSTIEYIDIGNIRAGHLVHGDMWWRPDSGIAQCEYPKGSGKNVAFAAGLWVAGYDPQHNLHVSAQTYRQSGNDYWPGPIDAISGTTTYSQEADWAQIWKVNRSTIDSFRMLHAAGLPYMPTIIREWPAKGNAYTKGTSGGYLTIIQASGRSFAPFVDVNNDGIYNAADGDYPDIKGDQMLWWVTTDAGTTHNSSGTTGGLGLEIHHSAYAYHRGGAIDNVIFYEYNIINFSASHYDSLRVGLWTDEEIGNGFSDYVGYDSVRRMGIGYNSQTTDLVYGTSIPMMGVAMMEMPDDSAGAYPPAGSFSYHRNMQTGPMRTPQIPTDYNNLLSHAFTGGTPFPNGSKYAVSLSQQCDSNATAFDQSFITGTKARTLAGGGTVLKVGMALVVCPNAGGCPTMSFSCLQATADTAFTVYHHPLPSTGIRTVTPKRSLMLYPNPAQDHLFFQSSDGRNDGAVAVYDAAGKKVTVGLTRAVGGLQLDIHELAAGVYSITYTGANEAAYGTFVKR